MKIENLQKSLPILYVLLLFSSAIRLITYYNGFGVNIIDFIELTEFAFSFIDDIYFYCLLIGGLIIWAVLEDLQIEKSNKTINEKNKKSDSKKIPRYFVVFNFIVYFSVFILDIFIDYYIMYKTAFYLVISIYIYFVEANRKSNKLIKYYLLIPVFFLLSYYDAKYEQGLIIEDNRSKIVTMIFKDKTIKTDEYIHLIGKTKNYSFIYDSKKKTTSIYKNNEILSYEFEN